MELIATLAIGSWRLLILDYRQRVSLGGKKCEHCLYPYPCFTVMDVRRARQVLRTSYATCPITGDMDVMNLQAMSTKM